MESCRGARGELRAGACAEGGWSWSRSRSSEGAAIQGGGCASSSLPSPPSAEASGPERAAAYFTQDRQPWAQPRGHRNMDTGIRGHWILETQRREEGDTGTRGRGHGDTGTGGQGHRARDVATGTQG
uniref:Uncharacterized protein n=1 Tax=Myotis myotis TaxID=51298 RepID=A0A7J7QZ25_MYOMY|nr:hypothetical protein mMyoMyo1_011267 [Myotis myotis]